MALSTARRAENTFASLTFLDHGLPPYSFSSQRVALHKMRYIKYIIMETPLFMWVYERECVADWGINKAEPKLRLERYVIHLNEGQNRKEIHLSKRSKFRVLFYESSKRLNCIFIKVFLTYSIVRQMI